MFIHLKNDFVLLYEQLYLLKTLTIENKYFKKKIHKTQQC